MHRPLRIIFLLASLLALVGCSNPLGYQSEKLYTYREVGTCNGRYVGESHTPGRQIPNCMALLVTAVTMRVVVETQQVTYVEEGLGHNKQIEFVASVPEALRDCKIVDRDNFDCKLLQRVDGKFTSTAAFGDRRLSGRLIPRLWAEVQGGWINEDVLSVFDGKLGSVLYGFMWFVAGLFVLLLLVVLVATVFD